MSQQYPQQPGWGQPQQPSWGAQPPQPGYPQQPGWGAPPPQPPKKTPVGKILGFGCLGVVALFVILAAIGAAIGGADSNSESKGRSASSSAPAVEKDDTAAQEKDDAPAEEPAPATPVKITAKKAAFTKSILADGSDYTSVKVTITNNSDDTININPLYFAITDTSGTKHTQELAVDKNQLDTTDLAPGENISGVITGKGSFTPKYVTYTDGLFGDPVRADVS